MKSLLAVLIFIMLNLGCNQSNLNNNTTSEYKQISITESNLTPTVDIENFTLISNNVTTDSINSIEILKLKRNLPLAMQRKDSSLFESILSNSFTYRGEDEFYKNKQDYIHNRIHAIWTIDTVKYENLVLQFFGEIAILTYRNVLNGSDENGKSDIEHYNWADIYTKEDSKWKIMGIHEIESRIEYPNK